MYDYLIVGAGLYGCVIANEMSQKGKKCLVIDRRDHIGGNCYTYEQAGINVHKYGAHIFRTSNKMIWDYINQFAEFNNFINSPIAIYKDELYNLPFNMNTFSKLWNIHTPSEAKRIIEEQSKCITGVPNNLEEHVIKLVGTDIYNKLVKGYTEKQWGRDCKDLPASVIRRIPVRFTYDNNYYNDKYQGIPIGGYTQIFEKMLEKSDVRLNEPFDKSKHTNLAKHIVYTGAIDEFFDYKFGELEYRSLRFETELIDSENYQGVAVVNYTGDEVPYTRCIEHKHFEFGNQKITVITREYSEKYSIGKEPYYPINDEKNNNIYAMYLKLCSDDIVIFGGRLGEYKYYDMQDTVQSALAMVKKLDSLA